MNLTQQQRPKEGRRKKGRGITFIFTRKSNNNDNDNNNKKMEPLGGIKKWEREKK